MENLKPELRQKLELSKNIWVATVRSDGRPHLVPVWFVYLSEKIYISIDPESVKSRNLQNNPQITLALEDGMHPLICEGKAHFISQPYPGELLAYFQHKYDWDIQQDKQYHQLVEITPRRWLNW